MFNKKQQVFSFSNSISLQSWKIQLSPNGTHCPDWLYSLRFLVYGKVPNSTGVKLQYCIIVLMSCQSTSPEAIVENQLCLNLDVASVVIRPTERDLWSGAFHTNTADKRFLNNMRKRAEPWNINLNGCSEQIAKTEMFKTIQYLLHTTKSLHGVFQCIVKCIIFIYNNIYL